MPQTVEYDIRVKMGLCRDNEKEKNGDCYNGVIWGFRV